MTDPTLNPFAAYGSDRWCADRLGKSPHWLRLNRAKLHREGFPAKDRLLNLTLKADVEAWLDRRRKVADAAVHHTDTTPEPSINFDAL